MINKEISYELLPTDVPFVLEKDWGVVFKSQIQKEIAIKVFEWKYGPQEDFGNMSIEAWQDAESVKFNKGYFKGKISFSLDFEKVSVFQLIILIATIVLGNRDELKTYIGGLQTLDGIFQTAVNVKMIPDDYRRCLYLKLIQLSSNNPNIPIELSKIGSIYNDDGSCCFSELFKCSTYSKTEHSCMFRQDMFDLAIKKLEEMKVIRVDDERKNAYIM